eukprot:TRINITY_DN2926_c0_g1_i1.p1 TRINITY_DN2926_c0_g1~~TRINITY_DN2926_c0_g1_i1.p1  ORF type:complete len:199 (-),score=50.80 TRINITY_DN2926_c0_g1_i1:54-602(-)
MGGLDTPVFGEESRAVRISIYACAFIIIGLSIAAVVSGLVIGITKDYQHLVYAIILLGQVGHLGLLLQWYRRDGLDPKFKYMIAGVSVLTLAMACNILMYAFGIPECPGTACWKDHPTYAVTKDEELCKPKPPSCLYYSGCVISDYNGGKCGKVDGQPHRWNNSFMDFYSVNCTVSTPKHPI